MAGDSLDPVRGGVLFFIGGCNKSLEALDDIYYLKTGLNFESFDLPNNLNYFVKLPF